MNQFSISSRKVKVLLDLFKLFKNQALNSIFAMEPLIPDIACTAIKCEGGPFQ